MDVHQNHDRLFRAASMTIVAPMKVLISVPESATMIA